MSKDYLALLPRAVENLKVRYNDMRIYNEIIKIATDKHMVIDDEYKKLFNYFYKVRRNSIWREKYYKLFEDVRKCENPTFENILFAIFKFNDWVESSFTSKMLATIKPEKPIWDSVVLQNIELKPSKPKDKSKRLKNAVEIYARIEEWYNNFNYKDAYIAEFDKNFPNFHSFSDTKKIDFLIWQIR